MQRDETREDQLKAAGYTNRTEGAVFCLVTGFGGLLVGAVFSTIGLNMLRGPELYDENLVLGGALGVALGVVIGLFKIQRGNAEAVELVNDREWAREMRKVRRED